MYMYILSLRPRDGYPLELRVLEDMDPWICSHVLHPAYLMMPYFMVML